MPTGSVGRSKSRCGIMKISPADPMALCIHREINQLLHLFNNSSTVKDTGMKKSEKIIKR
jgi:hypothetical protein